MFGFLTIGDYKLVEPEKAEPVVACHYRMQAEHGFTTNEAAPAACPVIGKTGTHRVIDEGLLHYEASAAGFAERYRRGETSHTIHVWWARRPHSAMRALVYASLVASHENQPTELLAELGQPCGTQPDILERARGNIARSFDGKRPKVLDLFAGGGTIPLEALRLGAETYALDSNQLAAFINSCNLEWATRREPVALGKLVNASGKRVLRSLATRTAHLFPFRDNQTLSNNGLPVSTYIWSYSTNCGECGYRFSLCKRPWLSKKNGRRIIQQHSDRANAQSVSVTELPERVEPSPGNWIGRTGKICCPKCGWTSDKISLDDCDDQLVALVGCKRGQGKQFTKAVAAAVPDPKVIEEFERKLLKELAQPLPTSVIPNWSGIVNPAVYGMKTHADVVNPRQKVVLLALLSALREEFVVLEADHGTESATGVISLLSGLVDQCIDWNCRLSMWISQNEQVGRAFCGPGVSMLWDYAETDPVSKGPSNLWAKLERIVQGATAVAGIGNHATVVNGCAQDLPFEDEYFDAVVTDPPYYDNIYYTVLADFFFSWKRILFGALRPKLFAAATTDTSRELVASRYRDGDRAHELYCAQFAAAFCEAARTLKKDGVLSLVYSHASVAGWDALIEAFSRSPLEVTSVQPLAIERRQRPRAMTAQAVNTCMVFVARKGRGAIRSAKSLDALSQEIQRAVNKPGFASSLQAAGWAEDDIALALFAQGVGVLCNADWLAPEQRLGLLNNAEALVQQRYSDFKLARRRSL